MGFVEGAGNIKQFFKRIIRIWILTQKLKHVELFFSIEGEKVKLAILRYALVL